MASAFAKSLVKKIDNLALVSNRTDMAELTADAQLQEVREVLYGLVRTAHQHSWAHVTTTDECGCKECFIKRARALMEKLEVGL